MFLEEDIHLKLSSIGNIALQVLGSDTGLAGVYNEIGAPADYEDIDISRPNNCVPLHTNLSSCDYSRTPSSYDMNGYTIPFQTTTRVQVIASCIHYCF